MWLCTGLVLMHALLYFLCVSSSTTRKYALIYAFCIPTYTRTHHTRAYSQMALLPLRVQPLAARPRRLLKWGSPAAILLLQTVRVHCLLPLPLPVQSPPQPVKTLCAPVVSVWALMVIGHSSAPVWMDPSHYCPPDHPFSLNLSY